MKLKYNVVNAVNYIILHCISMKQTLVINFVGAPGVGKSLFSALLYAELKLRGLQIEYIQEYVKNLIWQERFEEINNQFEVSYQQYKMLKAVDGKLDYIVTDGSLLLGLYYNEIFPHNVSNVEKTREMIKAKMGEFNSVYIFLEHGDFPFENEGRIHTYEESKHISVQLESLIEELELPCLKVKSNIENMSLIIDYILARRQQMEL
jgi:hypothetical protein